MTHRPAAVAGLVVYGTLLFAELVLIFAGNGGSFAFTLDDAYIHLALAEEIARGTYGVNPGEASAPASSILWPFLLAPFARAVSPVALAWPLVVNVLASLGTILVYARIASDVAPRHARLVVAFLVLATNLVALSLTGMEHTLQLFACALIVLGLSKADRTPGWLPFAIAAAPLVRFENLALSLPAIVALSALGQRRHAAIALAATVVPIVAFSGLLSLSGLGVLPASILVKSDVAVGMTREMGAGLSHRPAGALEAIGRNLFQNLRHRDGLELQIALIVLAAGFLFSPGKRERSLAAVGAAVIALHLAFGRFGWFYRYEVYAVMSAFTLSLLAHRAPIGRLDARASSGAVALFLAIVLSTYSASYVKALIVTPEASANIHDQHVQLHRFATEVHRAPIAVNDLGCVSFKNDHYVLDLVGLGSREVYRARRERGDRGWMSDLAERHGVGVAAIYENWFRRRPADWTPVGRLHLPGRRVSAAESVVTFFAVGAAWIEPLREELVRYARVLPVGIELEILGGEPAEPNP